jgi:hypothetical protein
MSAKSDEVEVRERFLSSSTPVTCSSLHNKEQGYGQWWLDPLLEVRSEQEVEVRERFLSSSTPVTCSSLHNKGQGYSQCCESGMFVPDPTFFHPGFKFFPSRIPDPHQRIEAF